MENAVADKLSALAHERRLDVFRLLMRRYPGAVPAGEIASALNLRPNTTSVYLSILRHAGLISQTRDGTYQLYQIRLEAVQDMFGQMLGDCCRNRPDICLPGFAAEARPAPTADRPLRVLFMCHLNSARSIMAEAMLRDAGPMFHARSAGMAPRGTPHPLTLEVLAQHELATSGLASEPVSRYLDEERPMDLVITVCDHTANTDTLRWPGAPLRAHWGVDDPLAEASEAAQRAAMQEAFAVIRTRIDALVGLPFGELDALALQGHLDDIGHMQAPLA